MVSTVHYPSFKNIGWRTEIRPRGLLLLLIGVWLVFQFPYFSIALLFITYITYGLARHLLRNRKTRNPKGTAGE